MIKARSILTAAALSAALIAAPAEAAAYQHAQAAEPGDEALSVTGAGRIAMSLDGRGFFHVKESGRLSLGLRWPGCNGTEFLGSGGLLLRFRKGEDEEFTLLGPGDFDEDLPGPGVADASEGRSGGIRYPDEGCDDDGDGAFDEDPLDGRDNDGDGAVDEDFASIGDGMYVTRFSAREQGITVTRSHHIWHYGHVRDFIGLTTTIEYEPRGDEGGLKDLEIIQYMDFDLGASDDPGRGLDDRALLMQALPEGEGGRKPPFAAVSDKGPEGPFAAVVIFRAASPGGRLYALAAGRGVGRNVEMLWNGERAGTVVHGESAAGLDRERAELVPGARGAGVLVTEEARADVVLTHRFGPAVDMMPGGRLEIEWAIVFGRDEETLARNISRARETWEGEELEGGFVRRWVVPARRAVRVPVEAVLAPVWVNGSKRPTAALELPDLNGEEIEWLRVAGEVTEEYESAGGRLMVGLTEERASGGPFTVEAQLTDGRVLTAGIDEEEILRFNGGEELQPGRLPDDSMTLFPNPFVTELEIDVLVQQPSLQLRSGRMLPAQPGAGSVMIYDVKGRLVRKILTDEVLHPGEHTFAWDGTDETGARVAQGVYYCRLQIGERSLTKRIILLK